MDALFRYWRPIAAGAIFAYFAACAPVKFDKVQAPPCGGDGVACVQTCNDAECLNSYTVERTIGEGLVDILIVNDNSGSMYTEQSKMGDRFPTFLDSLGGVDYRIAMTTTDISSKVTGNTTAFKNPPGPYNGYGALQDGNLIEFSQGLKFISKETPNKESLFFNTIRRPETLHCDQSGYRQCPSSDERGIYAANLVLERTAHQFARPTAHFAVIFLSDEDERGKSDPRSFADGTQGAEWAHYNTNYPLEDYDKPETLIGRFREKHPGKTLSVHSIIVKPGDSHCLSSQGGQGTGVRGVEGFSYAKLTAQTGGILGTICANDYGNQLASIATHIQSQAFSLPLACRPANDDYKVTFAPQPSSPVQVSADFKNLQIKVSGRLEPMTRLTLKYECLKPNE